MDKLTADSGAPETELHAASWAGDIAAVTQLLSQGVDVDITDSISESALHGAAAWARNDIVKLLLENGANPNATNQDGDSPLHWACSHGNAIIIELLIKFGAILKNNGKGQSPLEIAKEHNNQSSYAWLKTNAKTINSTHISIHSKK